MISSRSTAQMWTPDLWSPTLLCTCIPDPTLNTRSAGPGRLPKYGVRDPWETPSISIVQTLVLQRSRSWGTEKTLEPNPRTKPYMSFVWEFGPLWFGNASFSSFERGFLVAWLLAAAAWLFLQCLLAGNFVDSTSFRDGWRWWIYGRGRKQRSPCWKQAEVWWCVWCCGGRRIGFEIQLQQ